VPSPEVEPEFSMILKGLTIAGDGDAASVERALSEVRAARPVIIEGDEPVLVAAAEGLDQALAEAIDALAGGQARLVLPAARLRRLGLDRTRTGVVAFPTVDLARVEQLALKVEARFDAPVSPAQSADEDALELMRLALLLPAAIVVPVDREALDPAVLRVSADAVRGYRRRKAEDIRIVGRAPVPLEGARDTEFVVFRGGEGLRDQVAIVVGQPRLDQPVAVRLHSACLTGDLFGSLKCDCGDQLRETVRHMAETDGGILLYLDQEGRGNGIANKIRAYRLQAQGYDTYDADEVLGFDLDQRRFDFAAAMLRQLGVSRVRIMTNNPEKIAALTSAGLEVVAEERVLGRATAENVRYLASKRDRAGHYIDFDQLIVHAPAQD
jgi:GTP cyclohydrolase II